MPLIGFPVLTGVYTTDASIAAASGQAGTPGHLLGAVAVLGALLTAFYMTRLMILTFFGRPRWADGVHPHESPAVMTVPMVVLAVGSAFAGLLLVQVFPLGDWLEPVFGSARGEASAPA